MNARVAYGLLGLTLVLLVGGAWVAVNRQHPGVQSSSITPNATDMIDHFTLTSSAFTEGSAIPASYTCDGTQTSPPLEIQGAPAGAKTFALIMEDPDVPTVIKADGTFLHWVVFNIPATKTTIVEGQRIGVQGTNGAGKTGYVGPCPPKEHQPAEHRYVFTLYALDTELPLSEGASQEEVMQAAQGHVIAHAQLVGRYKRP